MNVVLENARVEGRGSRVESRPAPLAFQAGRVGAPAAEALRIDLRDHVVLPGFINAHDHLQLNCVPRLPHDAPFANSYEWIDAFEGFRQSSDVTAAVAVPSAVRHWHGGLKNVLAGATTVAHHDPLHAIHDDPDFPVFVVRDFGWSHSLGLGTTGRYGPLVVPSFVATPPHQPWIIHLAEGVDDVAGVELSRLDALGCLAENSVLVHGAGLSPCDVERVVAAGAAVVWCPASNVELFGRTLDPRPLADAGRLTLGSDSRLTGSRDLLDELRVASAESDLSPIELLRLVTANAASILRLSSRGSLDVGCVADCVVVQSELLETTRASIRAVVRGGVPLVADPDFAPWFEHCGIATVDALLDGRPKLIAKHIARPEAVALEPGLEIVA